MKVEKAFIGIDESIETVMITAESGKRLRRISDGWLPEDKHLLLGYVSYLFNGDYYPYPHFEVPEDYEEIDIEDEQQ